MAKGEHYNPRRWNGSRRNKIRERWRAIGAPCAICGKPIDYSLGMITDPVTGKCRPHPMSFVIDEITPVSRYMEGGYCSPEAAATDFDNTRPAHWICNARRGNGKRKKSGPPRYTAEDLPQPFDD